MKKSNLVMSIVYFLVGVVLILVAVLTNSKLDSILFSLGVVGSVQGIIFTAKYFYWNTPKNKEKYQERIANEKIEMHDELKVKLRDKSGRYAYILGLIVICISIMAFSILGRLEIIDNARMIVLYLGVYLMFQIVAGIAIFNYLLKKY